MATLGGGYCAMTKSRCLVLVVAFLLVAINGVAAQDTAGETVFDVTQYGAKGDGKTFNEVYITKAWRAACDAAEPARLVIPPGDFVAGEIVFAGPCAGDKPLTVEIQGTLMAMDDPSSYTGRSWISIERVQNVVVTGGGTINGKGKTAWPYAGGDVPLPVSLQFQTVGFCKMENLNFVDSMGFHSKVTDSHDVSVTNITITAPGTSPNTDGIHLSNATNVNVTDSTIGSGDDCVSIGQGSENVLVERIFCGPGHGLSIGSLGKREDETSVKGITIRNCTIKGTTNGARIKTYHQSPEMEATGIIYEDIVMDAVKNPIIIDQHYASKKKPGQSNVKISDVHFKNIRGTSITVNAISFQCSSTHPCENIELADIDLSPFGSIGPLKGICSSAKATITGTVNPAGLEGCV